MIKTLNYDFSEFLSIIARIQKNNGKCSKDLYDLRKELCKFFDESKCTNVIFTRNTDKIFFGMNVVALIEPNNINAIYHSDDEFIINEYIVEIDSKLLSEELNLNTSEILAILLHEVGHLVNNNTPIDKVRSTMDVYLTNTDDILPIKKTAQYNEILVFATLDLLHKYTSLFEKDLHKEIIADEFVIKCGYGDELQSALNKIVKNKYSLVNNVDDKLSVFKWTMRLYKDIKHRRIPAIMALKRASKLTGSELQKRQYATLLDAVNRVETETPLLEFSFDNMKRKYLDKINKIKIKGIRGLKDDLYEIRVMAKNVDLYDDALIIIRRINTNMSIIEDFLSENQDLDDATKQEMLDILSDYSDIRSKLVTKDLVKEKQILNITYPTINQK